MPARPGADGRRSRRAAARPRARGAASGPRDRQRRRSSPGRSCGPSRRGCRRPRPFTRRARARAGAARRRRRCARPTCASWKLSPSSDDRGAARGGDLRRQPAQRLARCRRAAASGRARHRRALLQVQVGHQQRALGLPATARRRRAARIACPATSHDAAPQRRGLSYGMRRRLCAQHAPLHGLGDQLVGRLAQDDLAGLARDRSLPISSMTGTASGDTWSSGVCRMRPLMRASICPSRPTSIRPVAASAPRASQQDVVRLVPAQHVVDQVGGEGDLPPGLLLCRDGAARSGRR